MSTVFTTFVNFSGQFFVSRYFKKEIILTSNIKQLETMNLKKKAARKIFILVVSKIQVAVAPKKASVDGINPIGDRVFPPLGIIPVYPHCP
jgi:hypothetical protein